MRILIALMLFGAGTLCEIYAYQMMQLFGRMSFAERFFGAGGTSTAWRVIGVGLIFAAFLVLRYGLFQTPIS